MGRRVQSVRPKPDGTFEFNSRVRFRLTSGKGHYHYVRVESDQVVLENHEKGSLEGELALAALADRVTHHSPRWKTYRDLGCRCFEIAALLGGHAVEHKRKRKDRDGKVRERNVWVRLPSVLHATRNLQRLGSYLHRKHGMTIKISVEYEPVPTQRRGQDGQRR